jgi:hypothetical protein
MLKEEKIECPDFLMIAWIGASVGGSALGKPESSASLSFLPLLLLLFLLR